MARPLLSHLTPFGCIVEGGFRRLANGIGLLSEAGNDGVETSTGFVDWQVIHPQTSGGNTDTRRQFRAVDP